MTGLASVPSPSKQRLRLWLRLLRATRTIENDVRELFRREFNTTLPRFDVLAALYRSESGLTMTELSRALMVSNGNVTGIVDRLDDDGFIRRATKQSDRRASHVRLTYHGRETFEKMAGAHEAWISRRLSDLDDEDTTDAIRLLKEIGQSAERHKR
ncbi:MarR family transcriptional regulator [bacterium AH-315-P15]|nr:MarR family transcriptional regulator [bacterium AH-315-P15]